MKILVTGADGFIGSNLIPYLTDKGCQVICAVRALPLKNLLQAKISNSCKIIQVGDICRADWSRYLESVDVIVHLAGMAHLNLTSEVDIDRCYKVNVEATNRLARAAIESGVKKFIYVSTIKVNGEKTSLKPFSEEDKPNPPDVYANTKYEAECILKGLSENSNLAVTIIRPPLVYGPNVKGNILRLMNLARKSVPLPLGCIGNSRSTVSVTNLADFINSCVIDNRSKNKTFNVSDGEDISTKDLIQRLAVEMNRPVRFISVPLPMLKMLGWFLGRGDDVARLSNSLTVNIDKARDVMNWEPKYSQKESLGAMIQWYKNQHSNRF